MSGQCAREDRHCQAWCAVASRTLVTAQVRQRQLAAAQREIAALKARRLEKWAGVFVSGVPYAEASLVTKGGSLWVATTATTTIPGEPGGDWRLIVKKGSA